MLDEHLHGTEARPITRLLKGGYFALSLLRASWYVRREYAPEKSVFQIRRRRFATALFVLVTSSGAITQYGVHSEHVNTEAMVAPMAIILVTELGLLSILAAAHLVLRYREKLYMDQDSALAANDIEIWREGELIGAFQVKHPLTTKDQIEFYASAHLARTSPKRARSKRLGQRKHGNL